MNIKKILFVVILFLLSAHWIFAGQKRKVLIYYFKNITGEEEFTELNYQIPFYLYSHMKGQLEGKKFILIDREGLQLYREDSTRDFWNDGVLQNISKKKGIDEIIYGLFYIQNGKPVIIGKIFYVKSGLILDITEKDKEYYDFFKEIENLKVDEISAYDTEQDESRKRKGYKPPFTRIVKSDIKSSWFFFQNSVGPYFPIGEWSGLYPPGIFIEYTFVYFPKMNIAHLGIGVNANIVELGRKKSGSYSDAEVTVLSLGASIQYIFQLRGFFEGIVLDVNFGGAKSLLFIDEERWSSIDPYVKGGINLIITPFGNLHMSFKVGMFSIDYKEMPMDALFFEIGILGF